MITAYGGKICWKVEVNYCIVQRDEMVKPPTGLAEE